MLEIDHDFCTSIYIRDPNENMVEFSHTTRPFTEAEIALSNEMLLQAKPDFNGHANATVHAPL